MLEKFIIKTILFIQMLKQHNKQYFVFHTVLFVPFLLFIVYINLQVTEAVFLFRMEEPFLCQEWFVSPCRYLVTFYSCFMSYLLWEELTNSEIERKTILLKNKLLYIEKKNSIRYFSCLIEIICLYIINFLIHFVPLTLLLFVIWFVFVLFGEDLTKQVIVFCKAGLCFESCCVKDILPFYLSILFVFAFFWVVLKEKNYKYYLIESCILTILFFYSIPYVYDLESFTIYYTTNSGRLIIHELKF